MSQVSGSPASPRLSAQFSPRETSAQHQWEVGPVAGSTGDLSVSKLQRRLLGKLAGLRHGSIRLTQGNDDFVWESVHQKVNLLPISWCPIQPSIAVL